MYTQQKIQTMISTATSQFKRWESDLLNGADYKFESVRKVSMCISDMHHARMCYDLGYQKYMNRKK